MPDGVAQARLAGPRGTAQQGRGCANQYVESKNAVFPVHKLAREHGERFGQMIVRWW